MKNYSLIDIVDYLKDYDGNLDTVDSIYDLIHGTLTQDLVVELEEFEYGGVTYTEKTFHLHKKFINQDQSDYYEGKSFYSYHSEIEDTHTGEKFSLVASYMNEHLLEVSLERLQKRPAECCEDPAIVEVYAKIDGDFTVIEQGNTSVQTPADVGLGKKKKIRFKFCRNCRLILD